jgi:FAD/FMN-containing dehydrogenase
VNHLVLWRSNGEIIACGPQLRRDWWAATIGGLGLTGVILQAEIQLVPVPGPWLEVETLIFDDLEGFLELADMSEASWQHTVAWIDVGRHPGRGVFFRGNPVAATGRAVRQQGRWRVPLSPPLSLVNRLSSQAFNRLYFGYHRLRQGQHIVHYQPFFYPLDSLQNWNRLYGPRGFYQYQCVVPRPAAVAVIGALLHQIARHGQASPLTVLKTFGSHTPVGMHIFAQPGVTLAIDFPNHGAATLQLLANLDTIVQEAGGRLYPAKDARMNRSFFEQSYPQLAQFLAYRDPGISSSLSRRLMGY